MWLTIILIILIILCFIPNPSGRKEYQKIVRRRALSGRTKKLVTSGTRIRALRCLDKELFVQWSEAKAKIHAIEIEDCETLQELRNKFPQTFSYSILPNTDIPPPSVKRFIIFDYPFMAWVEDDTSCMKFSRNATFLDQGDAPYDPRLKYLKEYFDTEAQPQKRQT